MEKPLSSMAVHRTSQFCPLCPPSAGQRYFNTTGSFKFFNNAWRTYTSDDIDRLNSALLSSDIESDKISEFLFRFFPNHPLVKFALSFNSEEQANARGHPVTIQFRPIDSPTEIHTAVPTKSPYEIFPNSLSDTTAYEFAMSPPCSTPEFDSDVSSSPDSFLVTNSKLTEMQEKPLLDLSFEFSSGLCVFRNRRKSGKENKDYQSTVWEVLAIRREGDQFYEIPKGHLEYGETLQQAAERELREETGILNAVMIGQPILSEIYTVKTTEMVRVEKTVHYFEAELQDCRDLKALSVNELWSTDMCSTCCRHPQHDEDVSNATKELQDNVARCQDEKCRTPPPVEIIAYFGQREKSTTEVCWISLSEAEKIVWKSNTILEVVKMVLNREEQ